jgi:hypothetical protein
VRPRPRRGTRPGSGARPGTRAGCGGPYPTGQPRMDPAVLSRNPRWISPSSWCPTFFPSPHVSQCSRSKKKPPPLLTRNLVPHGPAYVPGCVAHRASSAKSGEWRAGSLLPVYLTGSRGRQRSCLWACAQTRARGRVRSSIRSNCDWASSLLLERLARRPEKLAREPSESVDMGRS